MHGYKDNVLFLKHNLNAAAIGGLSTEMEGIEADFEQLITDMRPSIAEADRFLQTLPEQSRTEISNFEFPPTRPDLSADNADNADQISNPARRWEKSPLIGRAILDDSGSQRDDVEIASGP